MAIGYNPKVVTSNLVFAMDAANKKSYSPNTFPNPRDITSWWIALNGSGNGANCNVAQDLVVEKSPAGGIPMRMNVNGNDAHIPSWNSPITNISRANNGETWRVSVYARAAANTTGELVIFGANSGGVSFVNSNFIGITGKTININTTWQRFDHSITFNNTQIAFIQTRLDGTQENGAGNTIWWDGWQVERSDAVSSFSPNVNQNNASIINLNKETNNGTFNGNVIFEPANSSIRFKYTSSDYISFANTTDFMFLNTAPYTLEAWIYPTRNPGDSNWTGIFNRESNPGVGRDGYNIYFLGSSGTSTLFATERFTAGVAAAPNISLDQSVSVNNWHHIVATYDGAVLRLYRNTVLASTANSTGNITNQSATLTIGTRGGQRFDGKIGIARIYNKALSAAEIQQNFNATRARYGI
jgi:hypothetical protein